MQGLPEPTDGELVRAVARGDEAAFAQLYDRHAPWLSLRLVRRCNDWDAVAEALQDTFLTVWRSAGKWRGEGEVAAWLWGIAIRRLISGLRRTSRTALVVALVPAPEPSVPSAEEAALLAVEYGDVGAALSTLSPELRAVIQLTVLDGLSDRDTARALGLPLGTAKGRIRRAKKDWAWALRFWVGAFGLSVVALVVATSEGAALPRAGRSRVT